MSENEWCGVGDGGEKERERERERKRVAGKGESNVFKSVGVGEANRRCEGLERERRLDDEIQREERV